MRGDPLRLPWILRPEGRGGGTGTGGRGPAVRPNRVRAAGSAGRRILAGMATHPFRIVNVFTQRQGALTGNPLCVFEDGAAFDSATMQALARQFNLSETTFILPSSRADARVRIFTPSYEMPFAGHPTLGTAHVCRSLKLGGDELRLEMAVGLVAVASTRESLDADRAQRELARGSILARRAGARARTRGAGHRRAAACGSRRARNS